MARPRKQGLDYFPHDCDASSDEKIETLMLLYGTRGYAFYFILLERIYRTNELELDVSDAETIQILSKKIGINVEEFHQILNSALKHRCFDADIYAERRALTSEGIKRRSEAVLKKREQMRNLSGSKKQMKKIVTDAETQQETTPETPQSKVKKRKEKKNINNEQIENEFNELWSVYPRKEAREAAFKHYLKFRVNHTFSEAENAIKAYSEAMKQTEKKFICNGRTFFSERINDYINAKPPEALFPDKKVKLIRGENSS